MNRKTLGALGATLTLAASLSTAAPAKAAGTVTVTAGGCNTVRIANTTGATQYVLFDGRDYVGAKPGVTTSLKLKGGDHSWIADNGSETAAPTGSGFVAVSPCVGTAPRPVDGDQNGDKLADVLGIQAGTGNLYYYRMTSTGLASGIKAGTGWNSMVFMQQVNEIEGAGTPNYLIAVRNDGTVWRYDNKGYGKFANGRQIGSGLVGYDNFSITQTNSMIDFAGHSLLARKGDNLYAFPLTATGMSRSATAEDDLVATGWGATSNTISVRDFEGDHFGDIISIRDDGTMWADLMSPKATMPTTKQVGSGWGAMQTVTSPGSLNGDRLADLVARRSDGNLYKYINQGGRWSAATKIGQNWNGIRLLA